MNEKPSIGEAIGGVFALLLVVSACVLMFSMAGCFDYARRSADKPTVYNLYLGDQAAKNVQIPGIKVMPGADSKKGEDKEGKQEAGTTQFINTDERVNDLMRKLYKK